MGSLVAMEPMRAGGVCETGPRGGVTPGKGCTHYGSCDLGLFLLDPSVVLLPCSSQVVLPRVPRVPGSAPQPILGDSWPGLPQREGVLKLWPSITEGIPSHCPHARTPHATCTRLITQACLLQSQSGSFPRLLTGPHLFFTDVKGPRMYHWPRG